MAGVVGRAIVFTSMAAMTGGSERARLAGRSSESMVVVVLGIVAHVGALVIVLGPAVAPPW